jgi:hypothetical protein
MAAGVMVAGVAVVLAAHAVTGSPTHVTRFLEGAGRSPAGILTTFGSRFLVGVRMIARNPLALVPVLGIPALLAVVLRPPAAIRASLERHRVWRDALLVILLSSAVAYVANDTGPSAAGVGFAAAVGGLLWVNLAGQPHPAVEAVPPAPPPPLGSAAIPAGPQGMRAED